MMNKWAVLLAVGLSAAPIAASAGLLGATVAVDFYYPDQSTHFCGNGSQVVGAGVEYPGSCSGFAHVIIDIGDNQLSVNTGGTGWGPAAFNGFLLSVLSGPDIFSASYAGGTMGVTSLQITNGDLWVNFEGQGGGIAVFDFTTTSVPEPISLALLGLGLAGLGFSRRRKA